MPGHDSWLQRRTLENVLEAPDARARLRFARAALSISNLLPENDGLRLATRQLASIRSHRWGSAMLYPLVYTPREPYMTNCAAMSGYAPSMWRTYARIS
jgi:hypothetical protein